MHWYVGIVARIRLCFANIGPDIFVSASASCCLFGLALVVYIYVLYETRDFRDSVASSSLVFPSVFCSFRSRGRRIPVFFYFLVLFFRVALDR